MNRISATDTLHAAPENALVYSIHCNADTIRKSSAGVFDPSVLTWAVVKSDGGTLTRLDTLSACEADGLTLKYMRNMDSVEQSVESSMSHTVVSGMTGITLYVYKSGVLVAEKSVKVIADGEPGPPTRYNLLKNSDFAKGLTGWSHVGDTTVVDGYDGHKALYQSYSGGDYGDIGYVNVSNLDASLKADTTYTISFWAKGTAPKVVVIVYASGMYYKEFHLALSGEWAYYRCSFRIADKFPATLPYFRIYSGDAYICMPKLEEGDTATPWTRAESELGIGVSSVKEQWQLGSSATVAPTGTWLDTAPVPTRTLKFLWKRVTTTFTDGTTKVADPVVASVYTPGRNYYPDGEYSSTKNYRMTAYSAPFVCLGGLYYALTNESASGVKGVNPKTDVANNGGNWELFDALEYVMTKVLFAEWGKLASAVFYEEFMMSQYGTDASGVAVESAEGYRNFDYSNPAGGAFRPNILLNFLTGESWFRKTNVEGGITAGSMSYRIKTGGGDLTGYGLASGPGVYVLPSVSEGKTLQIRAVWANYSRANREYTFQPSASDLDNGVRIYVKPSWSNSYLQADIINLSDNTLYTFTSVYDSLSGKMAWILSESSGSAGDGDVSMLIDDAISSTSINPVQNKVISARSFISSRGNIDYSSLDTYTSFRYSGSIGVKIYNSSGTHTHSDNLYTFRSNGSYHGFEIHQVYDAKGPSYRMRSLKDTGNYTGWRTLAFTDSDITGNAATATKATKDGSGNVITSTYVKLDGSNATGTWDIDISGKAATATDLVGNITNKAPQLAASTESNEIRVVNNPDSSITVNNPASISAIRKALQFRWYNDYWQVGAIRGDSTGSVGWGVTYGNSKLMFRVTATGAYVYGTMYSGGGITMASDMRLKSVHRHVAIDLDTMADAPLFEYHFKSDSDKVSRLGTSAQYWQQTEGLVKDGKEGLSLDYPSLGVSMGISLAREVKALKTELEVLRKELEALKGGR